MSKQVIDTLFRDPLVQDDFVEEFNELDVVGKWTDTSADAGAAPTLAADGSSSVILTTGAVDNNEAYLHTNRTWDVVDGKPIRLEFRMKYTEANTDDANIVMGLVDAVAANELVDNGAGPAASYSGAVFYKVDGGTDWIVESSVAGAQVTNTVLDTTPGGGTYQSFCIEIRPISSTEATVTYGFDSGGRSHFIPCRDATTRLPISQTMTYASFAAADCVLGAKAGSANSETPQWDYVRVSQVK